MSDTANGNLILARSEGESVRIGDNITVKVMVIRGDDVVLAIQAPRSIAILRDDAVATARKDGAA